MGKHQKKYDILHCPSESEIELYLLTHIHNPHTANTVGSHIESCSKCRGVYEDLCNFYDTLLSNLSKSISNNVLDLMLRLAAGKGRGAIYALNRIAGAIESERISYSCSLLLDTGMDDWSNTMMRIKPSKYRGAEYILRAYLPANSKNLLIFLYAEKPEKIRDMRLEFEGLAKICTTNQCGIALLTQTSPHDLDGQVVHTTIRKSSNGYLTTRIKKLNLLHTI